MNKTFKADENLSCPYCNKDQGILAQDAIPTIPNIEGKGLIEKSLSVEEIQCNDCDEVFYTKLSEDGTIMTSNLPSKLLKN